MKKLLLLLLLVSCSVNDTSTDSGVKTTGDAVVDAEIADAIKQMSGSIAGMDKWGNVTLPTKATEKSADYYFFNADSFKWLIIDIFDGVKDGVTFDNEAVEKEVMEGNLTIGSVDGLTITSKNPAITADTIKSFDKLYTLETTVEKEWLTPKLDGSGKWENIIETPAAQYNSYLIVKKTDSTISIIIVMLSEKNTYFIPEAMEVQTFEKE